MSTTDFDYGVRHTWIEDETVLLIETEGDMRREAIDSWANSAIDAVRAWPRSGPIYMLHKLDAPVQGITPYSRKRAQDIADAMPEDRASYTAIVLSNNFVTHLAGFFLRTVQWKANLHQERIFTEYADALKWINAKQAEEKGKD